MKSAKNDKIINWIFIKQTFNIIDNMQKSFVQQSQSFIILRADDKFSFSKSFHLKYLVQSLTVNSLSIFKSFLHTWFNAIDQIINNNIDFNSVESK